VGNKLREEDRERQEMILENAEGKVLVLGKKENHLPRRESGTRGYWGRKERHKVREIRRTKLDEKPHKEKKP